MDIYRPTWLYIKQHKITGLKYFGKHTGIDPNLYIGSGKYWISHIKKHGKEHIETIWCELFLEQEALGEFAMFFSEFMDITNSKEWANLKPETGFDGGCYSRTTESRIKQSKTAKAKSRKQTPEWINSKKESYKSKNHKFTKNKETIEKHRSSMIGKNVGKIHSKETTIQQLKTRKEKLIDGCATKAKIHNYSIEFLLSCVFDCCATKKNMKKEYGFSSDQLIKKLSYHTDLDINSKLEENGRIARIAYYNRNNLT